MTGDARAALEQAIGEFHGVSLERVLAEIEYIRDPGDSVIAGGSLAYGLGNPLSDLDLLVTGPTAEGSPPFPLQHFVGSLRVDVWKLGSEFIGEAFDRAEKSLGDKGALLGAFGDADHEDELKLLHRVAFGVHVDGAELAPRRGSTYRAVASALAIREYAERMRAAALLAQLSLSAERAIAAAINARLAVEAALNAAVARQGHPFSGDKWLSERLENGAGELTRSYELFRRLPENPATDAPEFVAAALSACAELWGLDLCARALARAAEWRAKTTLRLAEVAGEQLLISPDSGALWSLGGSEPEAWLLLAPTGVIEPGARWGVWDCDEEGSRLCLRLHEVGLLAVDWTVGIGAEELSPALDLSGAEG